MRANLLTVRCSLMGTVLTKVVKERPLPRVKPMTLVLGSSACAVTFTSGTCMRMLATSASLHRRILTAFSSRRSTLWACDMYLQLGTEKAIHNKAAGE